MYGRKTGIPAHEDTNDSSDMKPVCVVVDVVIVDRRRGEAVDTQEPWTEATKDTYGVSIKICFVGEGAGYCPVPLHSLYTEDPLASHDGYMVGGGAARSPVQDDGCGCGSKGCKGECGKGTGGFVSIFCWSVTACVAWKLT